MLFYFWRYKNATANNTIYNQRHATEQTDVLFQFNLIILTRICFASHYSDLSHEIFNKKKTIFFLFILIE